MGSIDISGDAAKIVVACRQARRNLAQKLADLDPKDVTAHEIVRLDLARLDNLQHRAEAGAPGLDDAERQLLGLAGQPAD